LNREGILPEKDRDVKRYLNGFLNGAGTQHWNETYLAQFAAGSHRQSNK
jgi:hypothetical protein